MVTQHQSVCAPPCQLSIFVLSVSVCSLVPAFDVSDCLDTLLSTVFGKHIVRNLFYSNQLRYIQQYYGALQASGTHTFINQLLKLKINALKLLIINMHSLITEFLKSIPPVSTLTLELFCVFFQFVFYNYLTHTHPYHHSLFCFVLFFGRTRLSQKIKYDKKIPQLINKKSVINKNIIVHQSAPSDSNVLPFLQHLR